MRSRQKDAGFAEITSGSGVVRVAMLGCVHCGGHFKKPRFGTSEADKKTRVGRGYCHNCDGFICGPGCAECIPVDLLLTNMEKGRPENFRPIIVPAGG